MVLKAMKLLASSLACTDCARGEAACAAPGADLSHDPSIACITMRGTASGDFQDAPLNATQKLAVGMSSSRILTSDPVKCAGSCEMRLSTAAPDVERPAKLFCASFTSSSWSTAPAPASTMRGAV